MGDIIDLYECPITGAPFSTLKYNNRTRIEYYMPLEYRFSLIFIGRCFGLNDIDYQETLDACNEVFSEYILENELEIEEIDSFLERHGRRDWMINDKTRQELYFKKFDFEVNFPFLYSYLHDYHDMNLRQSTDFLFSFFIQNFKDNLNSYYDRFEKKVEFVEDHFGFMDTSSILNYALLREDSEILDYLSGGKFHGFSPSRLIMEKRFFNLD